jgi:formylglycine-generating enzyme required for sulfatase activity
MVEVGNIADATYSANLSNRASGIKASDGYTFTSPVGHFRANAFGLYDMHGNALQWCADWFDERYYASSPSIDPPGPKRGTYRVRRGGSWTQPPIDARSARRYHSTPPGAMDNNCGFRVARDL